MTAAHDPIYVAARTVLLDALDALHAYRSAIVLVGAQAVYLHTGSAGMTAAPFTTDGDLALNPTVVLDVHDPRLDHAMTSAGFALRVRTDGGVDPGTWLKATEVTGTPLQVPVDLIVPHGAMPGAGSSRGARLRHHGKTAAMLTHGLEAALVDHQTMTVTGLAPRDVRRVDIEIAGVGALLVAKLIKINERAERPGRLKDKDAGDIYRLIRDTPAATMVTRLEHLLANPLSAAVTTEAIDALQPLFGTRGSVGVQMAIRTTAQDVPAARVIAQLTTYANQVDQALGGGERSSRRPR